MLACSSHDSLVAKENLVMRGGNTCCVGLGCNSALIIVHITVKVLNASLITDPERRTASIENRNVMAKSEGISIQKRLEEVVGGRGERGETYETIRTPPPKFLIASAKASMASISKWLEGSSRTRM